MKNPRIEIVDKGTGEVIHTIPVADHQRPYLHKVMAGLLMQIDNDHYYPREVDLDEDEEESSSKVTR